MKLWLQRKTKLVTNGPISIDESILNYTCEKEEDVIDALDFLLDENPLRARIAATDAAISRKEEQLCIVIGDGGNDFNCNDSWKEIKIGSCCIR